MRTQSTALTVTFALTMQKAVTGAMVNIRHGSGGLPAT